MNNFRIEFSKLGNGRQPVRLLSYTSLTCSAEKLFQAFVDSQKDDVFQQLAVGFFHLIKMNQ
jgi:hypothetical protein